MGTGPLVWSSPSCVYSSAAPCRIFIHSRKSRQPKSRGPSSYSSESGSNKCSGRTGSDGPGNSRLGSAGKGSSDGKPTRVRTVLNEKQLHTLRTCYSANPRPDALMKEQLVEMTGLSPRVIRVWFQNKRCKDKKRAIALKQQIQQDKFPFSGLKTGYVTAAFRLQCRHRVAGLAPPPQPHQPPRKISPKSIDKCVFPRST
ncbi:hypothetical protein QTP88_012063 [Uroleucon formosanum]